MNDRRDFEYRDKRLEKLFPGEGFSLSPEKVDKHLEQTDGKACQGNTDRQMAKGSSHAVKTLFTPEKGWTC